MRRVLGFVATALLAANLPASADTTPRWPERPELATAGEPLPARDRPLRVFLDPGHGAEDNTGNRSAYCLPEQDFTLSLALSVEHEFRRLGIDTLLGRGADRPVPYAERVKEASAWGADVLVSLHSDIRGRAEGWSPWAGVSCLRSRQAPGFSVLYSDAGETSLAQVRRNVALRVAASLHAFGFLAYNGSHYGSDYAADDAPGVFVDRHPESKRIFMLYASDVPTVLIETHNALDDREVRLWESEATRTAFAKALAQALAVAQPERQGRDLD